MIPFRSLRTHEPLRQTQTKVSRASVVRCTLRGWCRFKAVGATRALWGPSPDAPRARENHVAQPRILALEKRRAVLSSVGCSPRAGAAARRSTLNELAQIPMKRRHVLRSVLSASDRRCETFAQTSSSCKHQACDSTDLVLKTGVLRILSAHSGWNVLCRAHRSLKSS